MGRAITVLIGAVMIAAAIYLAVPNYQIVMGENQTIVWRLNTRTGELAVCTSPDLPGAGCRPIPEPKTGSGAQTGSGK